MELSLLLGSTSIAVALLIGAGALGTAIGFGILLAGVPVCLFWLRRRKRA